MELGRYFKFSVYLLVTCLLFAPDAGAAKKGEKCALIPNATFIDTHAINIVLPVKRLHLRLLDGRALRLEVRDTLDLLDLKKIGRGIMFTIPLVDAAGVPIDQTIPVVAMALEIHAKGHAELVTDAGALCHMQIPHLIEVILPEVAPVRTNIQYLIKVAMPASQLLLFRDGGNPCKLNEMKCEVPEAINAFAVRAMFDEF